MEMSLSVFRFPGLFLNVLCSFVEIDHKKSKHSVVH